MAVLHYSSSLSLDLRDAADKQRNGEDYVIGASISVSKRVYEKMFEELSRKKSLVRALKKISYKKIEIFWWEIYGIAPTDVYIPQGPMYTTPCIYGVTLEAVLVSLPFHIPGATGKQIEPLLEKCTKGSGLVCVGSEIRIELPLSLFGTLDML